MNIDTQKMIQFLNEKWQGTICPYCRGPEWNVENKMFELREYNKGNLYLGGPNSSIVPVVPVTCSNCGHTVLVNALVAKVMEEK